MGTFKETQRRRLASTLEICLSGVDGPSSRVARRRSGGGGDGKLWERGEAAGPEGGLAVIELPLWSRGRGGTMLPFLTVLLGDRGGVEQGEKFSDSFLAASGGIVKVLILAGAKRNYRCM